MKRKSRTNFKSIILASLLMVLLATAGCGTRDNRPSDVLDKPTMVKTLIDVYVMEEKVRRLSLSPDSTQKVFERLKTKVFEADTIQDSVFRKSLDYYMGQPKEMQQIYTALVDSLNLREQKEPLKE